MSSRTFSALLSGVRFGKFASVGAVGAVFDVTTTTALIVLFDVLNEYAKLVGAEVAIVVMFFVNENWTFADAGESGILPTLRRLLTSNVVRSGGLLVQFLVVRAFREAGFSFLVLGFDVWELLPIPLAIGASMLLNYVAESVFTWRIGQS
ncbi:GtrA family protein [Halogeometricum limi]|uniref:Flippase GtrA (Transmembrane translocase of bactoprenol-linked glucose) n=1 Tax=Halogeometricum limi TaxID=555875 RepID=A0A1I6G566_9EURY|nr:GtrA family protein [Halogeometricum limi]SFR37336.1 Putative flippase GtrA (transmembrane translocase of bactoprenol-linked glucose) [Halogeometricum limi]